MGDSERNPYPGWMACAPVTLATAMILSITSYSESEAPRILEDVLT
jgi:hypothetical protein